MMGLIITFAIISIQPQVKDTVNKQSDPLKLLRMSHGYSEKTLWFDDPVPGASQI